MMKVVPVWVLLLLVALVLLLCNALCTSFQQPPEKGFYLVVLVLVGFVSSVMWISAIAQELVSLLNALGLMLNISRSSSDSPSSRGETRSVISSRTCRSRDRDILRWPSEASTRVGEGRGVDCSAHVQHADRNGNLAPH